MKIFISYRRQDTDAYSGWVSEHLVSRFGSDAVFVDVHSLAPGVNFPREIARAIQDSTAVIALIGPSWNPRRTENDPGRLFDAGDWVRKEISTALDADVSILPVLVDGTPMPSAESLPRDIAAISLLNAARLTYSTFRIDMADLIAAIERTAAPKDEHASPERASDESKSRFIELDRFARSRNAGVSNFELWRDALGRLAGILAQGEAIVDMTFARIYATGTATATQVLSSYFTWVVICTDRRLLITNWGASTVLIYPCADFVSVRRGGGVLQHEVHLTTPESTVSFYFKRKFGMEADRLIDYLRNRLQP